LSAETVHVASGPGMHEIISLLNLAVIAVIVFVAARKGIKQSLLDRSADISKNLIQAGLDLKRMQEEIDRARGELTNITHAKEKLLTETRTQGEKFSKQLIADAEQSAKRIIVDAQSAAKNEISGAAKQLKQVLVKRAVEESFQLVSDASSDSQSLRTQIHNRLIERFISETPKLRSHNGRS
jgi:F0F1-type ATP synthase membrane subunit b/b'